MFRQATSYRPLDRFCADCGAELATIPSAALCFDSRGNTYCCDDCRRDAESALWESAAYPVNLSRYAAYVD